MAGISFDKERINLYFRGKFSKSDASYIDEVFCDDSKVDALRSLLSKQFNEILSEDSDENKNLDNVLYRIHYEINTKSSVNKRWSLDNVVKWTFRIAVIILLPLLIILGVQTYNGTHLKKEAWVEIKTPAWTKAQFSLPDGTTGWLNNNSSLRYNGNFYSDRRVILKGEAYFDVYKDKKRPFIVNTNEVSLKVLGTRFNIASYDNEKDVEIVLEEGKLMFNNTEMNKSYTMIPNDLIIYDKTSKEFSTEVVQPHKYLSWTEGKLVFRNDPLDVIARRLERWYNIDVEIDGTLAADLRLRATFVDEGLEEVLDLLKRSLPIDYRIENGELKSDYTFAKKKVIISTGTK
jgi:ferric-dicitrate binding protein FerR (iron transport regulator)